jgi:hypothetical protein
MFIFWPAPWSSGQNFWLMIMRPRVRFPVLPSRFFLEGEDSHGHHGLSGLLELRFKVPPGTSRGPGSSVGIVTTGWTVRGSNPCGGEIFRTCPDRPWGPPSLLYNGYRVFPGGKSAGACCWPPIPFLGPWWPVIGWPLPLPGTSYSYITIHLIGIT